MITLLLVHHCSRLMMSVMMWICSQSTLTAGNPLLCSFTLTDTSGPADYNLRLSVRRAEAVKAVLVDAGIPAENITTIGRGQEDLLVPTPDDVREPQNRRAQIQFEK